LRAGLPDSAAAREWRRGDRKAYHQGLRRQQITVKRLRRRGNVVALEAENPEFSPIEVDLRRDTLVIEGIAVGVIRNAKSF